MNEPNLDSLSTQISSKFSLVTLAMKRARQIKAGSRPLIDTFSQKPVTIALQEILGGTVRLGPQIAADQLEAEEQEAMLRAIGLSEPTSVSVTRRMEEIFGRDEEEAEFEDYDEYEEGEEVETEEEEKSLIDSDTDEEEEELSKVPTRRGSADYLTEDAEAIEELEEEDLEIADEDQAESEDDGETHEEEKTVPVEELPRGQRAKTKTATRQPTKRAAQDNGRPGKSEKSEPRKSVKKKTVGKTDRSVKDEKAREKTPARKPGKSDIAKTIVKPQKAGKANTSAKSAPPKKEKAPEKPAKKKK